MAVPDYYAILGVPKDATAADIKSAYLQLARILHPDKNKGTTALGTRFQQVTEAYRVLSNPDERAAYDLKIKTGNKGQPPPPGQSPPPHPYWTTPHQSQPPPPPPPGSGAQAQGAGIATAPAAPRTNVPTGAPSRLRRFWDWLVGHPKWSGVITGLLVVLILFVIQVLASPLRTASPPAVFSPTVPATQAPTKVRAQIVASPTNAPKQLTVVAGGGSVPPIPRTYVPQRRVAATPALMPTAAVPLPTALAASIATTVALAQQIAATGTTTIITVRHSEHVTVVGSIDQSNAQATATPPTKPRHLPGVLFRYTGNSVTDTTGQSPSFSVRGPFTVWAKVWPINPHRVADATGIDIFSKISSQGDSEPAAIAIDIGGKPLITSTRVTDLRCQFSCWISVGSADNLHWDVRVEL